MEQHDTVVVYTSNNCQTSRELLQWLDENKVDYQEKNTTEYPDYLIELQDAGHFGTPTTFVGHHAILGFQPAHLKQELNLF
ncbi:glutaredoxin family protein [Allobacillus sp. GCM10007491]|uniref:Glutaredoxin family protein n=1 Tax=Allobacillus saliphilus TaxID=2912308 RepID=A0A941CVW9_9BACI|nr:MULTISPECIES: glutaredoxin family protein [Allobacillus]MBR7554644.1 glutaredoxin family protein [Allobacillus saliphilus]